MMMCLISNVLLFITIVLMLLKVKIVFMNLFVILLSTIVEDLIAYNAPQRSTQKQSTVDKVYEALIYMTGLTQKDFDNAGISMHNSELFEKDLINFLLEQYDLYRRRSMKISLRMQKNGLC